MSPVVGASCVHCDCEHFHELLFEAPVQEAGVSLDAEQETLTMKFPAALAPGSATLRLQFTGVLNDKMRGFYRTKYAVAGEERWAAVTQFEATDARQAFPCWDEPAVKATFDIVIVAPKDRCLSLNHSESCIRNIFTPQGGVVQHA